MEIDHLKDLGVDRSIINKIDLQEVGWESRTGIICFRIGTGGGHLCVR
jgi:hypothetical protein